MRYTTVNIAETGKYADDEYATFSDVEFLPAVIMEELPSGKLGLIDGYHRIASARALGYTEVNVVVVNEEELDLCSEFGSGDMSEAEWIEWVESQYDQRLVD